MTLTSDWLDFNYELTFDAQGNLTSELYSGIVERVHLPDGGVFISAGRVDVIAQGFPEFVLAPNEGTIQNLSGFCGAFGL